MTNVLDKELKSNPEGPVNGIIRLCIYAYAALLTLIMVLMLSFMKIKDVPTPLEARGTTEIHASYAMLAGLCISVGDCGNDQVVVGLEKNGISKGFYKFLIWKQGLKKDK